MEQVLAPRFDFTPKDAGPKPGFDYGAGGYKEGETNFGVNDHGQMHFEIKGLKLPKSVEATRICREDLNEVIASFVQSKSVVERGALERKSVVSGKSGSVRVNLGGRSLINKTKTQNPEK